jgi:hypothetical protein
MRGRSNLSTEAPLRDPVGTPAPPSGFGTVAFPRPRFLHDPTWDIAFRADEYTKTRRLRFALGLQQNQIARSCAIGQATVIGIRRKRQRQV